MAEKAVDKGRKEKVDLNKAGRDELVAVPGIGAAAADAVVKYREERGRFNSVDELDDVPGIGPATLEQARAHLSVPGKGGDNAETAKKGGDNTEAMKRAGEETVATVRHAGERGAEAAKEVVERGAETAAQIGKTNIEALERASEQTLDGLRSATETASKGYQELASMGKDNIEAMAASTRAVFEGVQQLNREWLGFVQEQLRDGAEASRALSRCRSTREMIELQTDYARSSLGKFMSETAKLTNITARMMSDSLNPLQGRARQNVERAVAGGHRAQG